MLRYVATTRFSTNQRGAVLVVSLLLLLVMTILALSATQTSLLQERMSGNMRDRELAFQSAEAGLRDAEKYMWSLTTRPELSATYSAANPIRTRLTLPADMSNQPASWWSANSNEYGASGTQEISGVISDPHYVLEEMEFVPYALDDPNNGRTFYRLTATAAGVSDSAVVVVQSTFARPD
jgi:type IV pilus assembly protein PilX